MSEDVTGKLARFTPAGVDRDALLFAAGRASVRPSRFWKLAAAVLLASQAVTLAARVWPRPVPPASPPPPTAVPVVPESPPVNVDPYSILALSQNNEVVAEPLPGRMLPDAAKPLTAFSRDLIP